ncbi:MAG: 3-isopropylmalate dehydratase small subunit [Cyanobium sp.]|jgi:3-isopropylmalate/(R)-2-methylmalate dehydratase small subunit
MSQSVPVPAPFPSGPVRRIQGRGVAVVGNDIDTDRIIPARFLKCVSFDGLAQGAFADDRLEQPGAHPFDRPEHQGATILVVNGNFGCGSSREHAPQALMRWGIRALIGESFAEIFFGNCLALGIPCLIAPAADLVALQAALAALPEALLDLDVEALRLTITPAAGQGDPRSIPLSLAEGPQRMLVSGQWDGTGQLLAHDAALRATAARLPYLAGFGG